MTPRVHGVRFDIRRGPPAPIRSHDLLGKCRSVVMHAEDRSCFSRIGWGHPFARKVQRSVDGDARLVPRDTDAYNVN
jgi:hypothetical protein